MSIIVIFGAAVRADGTPSGTLKRRTLRAAAEAEKDPRALIICSGGLGRFPPPECEVMADLLEGEGINPDRIIEDPVSVDTLGSVLNCLNIIDGLVRPPGDGECRVLVCTSDYHAPRCVILFRLLGMSSRALDIAGDRQALGLGKYLYYWFREAVATPYDAILAICHRAVGRPKSAARRP